MARDPKATEKPAAVLPPAAGLATPDTNRELAHSVLVAGGFTAEEATALLTGNEVTDYGDKSSGAVLIDTEAYTPEELALSTLDWRRWRLVCQLVSGLGGGNIADGRMQSILDNAHALAVLYTQQFPSRE